MLRERKIYIYIYRERERDKGFERQRAIETKDEREANRERVKERGVLERDGEMKAKRGVNVKDIGSWKR